MISNKKINQLLCYLYINSNIDNVIDLNDIKVSLRDKTIESIIDILELNECITINKNIITVLEVFKPLDTSLIKFNKYFSLKELAIVLDTTKSEINYFFDFLTRLEDHYKCKIHYKECLLIVIFELKREWGMSYLETQGFAHINFNNFNDIKFKRLAFEKLNCFYLRFLEFKNVFKLYSSDLNYVKNFIKKLERYSESLEVDDD